MRVHQFLSQHFCLDLQQPSTKLVLLDSDLEVKKALLVFVQHGLDSCGVWNADKQELAGMLSTLNFLQFIQSIYHSLQNENSDLNTEPGMSVDAFEQKLSKMVDSVLVGSLALSRISGGTAASSTPLPRISPEQTLVEVARVLTESAESTSHASLPVVTADGELLSTISDHRILKFISFNYNYHANLPRETIDSTGIGTYDLVTALPSSPVIAVIDQFLSYPMISAIPIVDDSGMMVDIVTTSDIVNLIPTGIYRHLESPISQILASRSFEAYIPTCTSQTSIQNMLDMIRTSPVVISRFYILQNKPAPDDQQRLIGVVSCLDLLRYLLSLTS